MTEIEICEACKKTRPMKELLETPLGYFICQDSSECIAEFSGWNEPAERERGKCQQ
jgi:hypothetical protein